MACGTGKTYTSLKIAEKQVGKGKLVLFLVPSLSLLSQTLTDWKQQCIYPVKAFAVCSDSSTGKADLEDLESLTVGSELSYPATTDAMTLGKEVTKALENKNAMTVIFSTYQSIDVIHQAQNLSTDAVKEFDLVVVMKLTEPQAATSQTRKRLSSHAFTTMTTSKRKSAST